MNKISDNKTGTLMPQDTQSSPSAEPASKARLRLWLRLLKGQRKIENRLREKLRDDHSSTLPRFDVLAALSREPEGLKMSQLSDVLKVSNGNVTGIVDRLSKDGFLERVPVEGDRRAMRVCLTKSGRDHFATLAKAHEGWIDEMLSEFTAEEAEDIAARLASLMDHMEGEENT
jgi:DNA-binding MarR family transcriptional regulator